MKQQAKQLLLFQLKKSGAPVSAVNNLELFELNVKVTVHRLPEAAGRSVSRSIYDSSTNTVCHTAVSVHYLSKYRPVDQ